MSAPELHILNAAAQAWGDYGNLLANGLADGSQAEVLQLERTGPFVPPITFPWPYLVVTDAFKSELESEMFDGIAFREAVKRKIVHLDWHLWNKELDEPEKHPRGGEPENYIRRGKHNADIAAQIGPLWNLVVPVRPGLQLEGKAAVDISRYDGRDLCCGSRFGYKFISERLRRFLESRVGEWVDITPARTVRGA